MGLLDVSSMELNDSQKQSVAKWINEGLGLSEVQERIKNDFDESMTYMDVRFLVDDLDLDLVDEDAGENAQEDQAPEQAIEADAELVEGGVSVDVDTVQRPGAVVSGSVTFSDGEKCAWQVDPMGRLGIIPPREDYKPSEEGMAEFQQLLRAELQKKGFA